MSFCIGIVSRNGYVFASDSRTTITNTVPNSDKGKEDNTTYKNSFDGFPKIIHLKKASLSVAAAGVNTFNGLQICNVISDIEDELCEKTVEEALNIIGAHIVELHPQSAVNLCAAKAIKGSDPEMYYMDITYNEKTSSHKCVIGQTEGNWCVGMPISQIFAMYSDASGLCVPFNMMPITEVVDFARSIVQMHIDVYRFDYRKKPVVGGKVQVLCVDRQGNVVEV